MHDALFYEAVATTTVIVFVCHRIECSECKSQIERNVRVNL